MGNVWGRRQNADLRAIFGPPRPAPVEAATKKAEAIKEVAMVEAPYASAGLGIGEPSYRAETIASSPGFGPSRRWDAGCHSPS